MYYRKNTYSHAKDHPTHGARAGHIYYVRLKTSLGPFYKLGFTTMASVRERLAFKGLGHDAQIDEVLGFVASPNALAIEQILHGHFSNKQAFIVPDALMPFAGNGQSELYVEDILNLDYLFTREQARRVRARIVAQRTAESVESIEERIKLSEEVATDVEELANLRFVRPFSWIWRTWCKVERWLFTSPDKKKYQDGVQGLILWYRGCVAECRDQELKARYQRVKEAVRLRKELDQADAADDQLRRDSLELRTRVLHATFDEKVTKALAAREAFDFQTFEVIVDVERLVYNLAEAMTENLTFGSDYMIVANNCGLLDLMDAISDGNPREVLMGPVQEGYKTLLRHWVTTGELLSEDLPMPPDPRFYRSSDGKVHEVSPISKDNFGPSWFLDLLGRQWHLAKQPSRAENTWAEFDVSTLNTETGFCGQFVIRVEPNTASGQLEVKFPNFFATYWSALSASVVHTGGGRTDAAHSQGMPTLKEREQLREITGFGVGPLPKIGAEGD
jgi:hypothetical protein